MATAPWGKDQLDGPQPPDPKDKEREVDLRKAKEDRKLAAFKQIGEILVGLPKDDRAAIIRSFAVLYEVDR